MPPVEMSAGSEWSGFCTAMCRLKPAPLFTGPADTTYCASNQGGVVTGPEVTNHSAWPCSEVKAEPAKTGPAITAESAKTGYKRRNLHKKAHFCVRDIALALLFHQ